MTRKKVRWGNWRHSNGKKLESGNNRNYTRKLWQKKIGPKKKKKKRKNQWQKKLKIYNIQVYLFGEGGVFKIDVRFGIVGLNLPKKNNTAFLSGERIECRQQN